MDSYNSAYPLAYYEIGTPYMFYRAAPPQHGNEASADQVKKYAPVLKKTSDDVGSAYCFSKRFKRYIGVVVGKNTEQNTIEVMFQAKKDGKTVYFTTKYIVNHSGVFFDDKEQFAAHGIVDLNGSDDIEFSDKVKSGGIIIDKPSISGGIVLDEKIVPSGNGIVIDN